MEFPAISELTRAPLQTLLQGSVFRIPPGSAMAGSVELQALCEMALESGSQARFIVRKKFPRFSALGRCANHRCGQNGFPDRMRRPIAADRIEGHRGCPTS